MRLKLLSLLLPLLLTACALPEQLSETLGDEPVANTAEVRGASPKAIGRFYARIMAVQGRPGGALSQVSIQEAKDLYEGTRTLKLHSYKLVKGRHEACWEDPLNNLWALEDLKERNQRYWLRFGIGTCSEPVRQLASYKDVGTNARPPVMEGRRWLSRSTLVRIE